MNFATFIALIFSFFHTMLSSISSVFSILITNNIIKLALCIGILIFLIEYHFEIINLLPRILGLTGEQEKEYDTKSVSVSKSESVGGNIVTRTHNITKRKRVK